MISFNQFHNITFKTLKVKIFNVVHLIVIDQFQVTNLIHYIPSIEKN